MGTMRAGTLLHQIQKWSSTAAVNPLSDAELLERFSRDRDEAAFTVLLQRYGRLVWSVCRRVLRSEQDIEDAFQATFCLLGHKSGTIRKSASVGSWLYGVAYRTAMKAKKNAVKRREREEQAQAKAVPLPSAEVMCRELQALLDTEIVNLPEKLRAPFILCCLEGKTKPEAAAALGWKEGTVSSRLANARRILIERLAARGVELSVVLGALTLSQTTVQSALRASTLKVVLAFANNAPVPSAAVAALIQEVSQAMKTGLMKTTALILIAAGLIAGGAGVFIHRSLSPAQAELAAQGTEQDEKQDPVAGRAPTPDEIREVTVNCRVLGPSDAPLADASVVLLAKRLAERIDGEPRIVVAATAKTDHHGRCVLRATGHFENFRLLAHAKRQGLGYGYVPTGTGPAEAVLRLRPEQTFSGRLITPQGQPAEGVRLRVERIIDNEDRQYFLSSAKQAQWFYTESRNRKPSDQGIMDGYESAVLRGVTLPASLAKEIPSWPADVTTDKIGRFQIHGLSRNQKIVVVAEDKRFAPQELTLEAPKNDSAPRVPFTLERARIVEGRVLAENTGKPIAKARVSLHVDGVRKHGLAGIEPGRRSITTQTDDEGRFSLHPYATDFAWLEVAPPPSVPYLGLRRIEVEWKLGGVRQSYEVKLLRGVLVKGRVIEKNSGRPIDQAKVICEPVGTFAEGRPYEYRLGPSYPVFSRPDGTFQMVVPATNCHLLVTGPDAAYIVQCIGSEEVRTGDAGGRRDYYHGVLALHPRPGDNLKEAIVTLRRGTTIQGEVRGPDGKPMPDAVLFCDGDLAWASYARQPESRLIGAIRFFPGDARSLLQPVALKDGRFELHGCDPDKTYRLSFLDASKDETRRYRQGDQIRRLRGLMESSRAKLGATVEVSVKGKAAKPIQVQLGECGSAEVRLLDAAGELTQGYHAWLELVLSAGPTMEKAIEKKTLAGEILLLAGTHPSLRAQPWWGAAMEMYSADFDLGVNAAVSYCWNTVPTYLKPDGEGRLKFPALIPGATYRLRITDSKAKTMLSNVGGGLIDGGGIVEYGKIVHEQEFRVESGKVRKLADVILTRGK